MRFDSRRRTSLVDTSRTARRMLPDRSGRRPNPRCTGIWPAASTCGHIRSVCTLLPHPRRQMPSQRCERRPRQNDAHEIGLFEPHPGTCRHVQALTREMSASRVKQQASGKHTMPAARTVVRRCCCWATCGREGHVGADCELEAGAARGGGGAAGLLPAIIQGSGSNTTLLDRASAQLGMTDFSTWEVIKTDIEVTRFGPREAQIWKARA